MHKLYNKNTVETEWISLNLQYPAVVAYNHNNQPLIAVYLTPLPDGYNKTLSIMYFLARAFYIMFVFCFLTIG